MEPEPASSAPDPRARVRTLGGHAARAATPTSVSVEVPVGTRPIVLISCSDTKQQTHGRKVPAGELYTSPLFRQSLAYARAITSEDRIRILSALHGVLKTTDPIATYDFSIGKLNQRERDSWGERVHQELGSAFGYKNPADVILLAGADYVRALGGLTGAYRTDRLPWIIDTPLAGMQVGERLHWLNGQLYELGADAGAKPEPAPPAVERSQIVRFLKGLADEQPTDPTGTQIASVLRSAARTIEYQTGPARAAALAHLAEGVRKWHGEVGKALSKALNAVEQGRHVTVAATATVAPGASPSPALPIAAPEPSLPPSWLTPVQEDPQKAIVRYVGAKHPQLAGAEGRVVGRTGHDLEVQWRERGGARRMPKAGDPRWFQGGEVRLLHGYSEDFRREGETWPEHARDPDSRYLVALRDELGSERGAEEAFAVFRDKRQDDWLGHPTKIRIIFLALKHLLGEAAAVKAQNALANIDMPDTRFQRGDRVYVNVGREKGRTGNVTKLFGAPSLDQREVTLDLRPGERTPQVLRQSIAYLERAPEMPAQAPTPAPPSAAPSVLATDEMQRRIAQAAAASSVALAHASRPDSDLRERVRAEEAHQKAAGVWLLDVADELPEGDMQRHAASVSDAHQAARDFLGKWRMEESTPVHNDAQRALRAETLRQTQAAWPLRVEDVRKALAEATSSAPAAAPAAGPPSAKVRAPGGIGALAALAESRRVPIPSTAIPSTALTPRDRTVDVGRGLQIVFDQREEGQETPLWEGRIFWEGRQVGTFKNDGRGGETIIQPARAVEAFQAAVDAAAPEVSPSALFEREALVLTFAERKLFDPTARDLTLADIVWDYARQAGPAHAPSATAPPTTGASLWDRVIVYMTAHPAQQATAIMRAVGKGKREQELVLEALRSKREQGVVSWEKKDGLKLWSLKARGPAARREPDHGVQPSEVGPVGIQHPFAAWMQPGARVHNMGDIANPAQYGHIVRTFEDEWYRHVEVEWEDGSTSILTTNSFYPGPMSKARVVHAPEAAAPVDIGTEAPLTYTRDGRTATLGPWRDRMGVSERFWIFDGGGSMGAATARKSGEWMAQDGFNPMHEGRGQAADMDDAKVAADEWLRAFVQTAAPGATDELLAVMEEFGLPRDPKLEKLAERILREGRANATTLRSWLEDGSPAAANTYGPMFSEKAAEARKAKRQFAAGEPEGVPQTALAMRQIVVTWIDIKQEVVPGEYRADLGGRPKLREVPEARAAMFDSNGTTDVFEKARAYALKEGPTGDAWALPLTEKDPLGTATRLALAKYERHVADLVADARRYGEDAYRRGVVADYTQDEPFLAMLAEAAKTVENFEARRPVYYAWRDAWTQARDAAEAKAGRPARPAGKPAKPPNFAEAKKMLLAGLGAEGWELSKSDLKVPWAEKGGIRLWFQARAIYIGTNKSFGDAHSLTSDMKEYGSAEDLIRAVERYSGTSAAPVAPSAETHRALLAEALEPYSGSGAIDLVEAGRERLAIGKYLSAQAEAEPIARSANILRDAGENIAGTPMAVDPTAVAEVAAAYLRALAGGEPEGHGISLYRAAAGVGNGKYREEDTGEIDAGSGERAPAEPAEGEKDEERLLATLGKPGTPVHVERIEEARRLLALVRARPGTAGELGIRADLPEAVVVHTMLRLATLGLVSVDKSNRVWTAQRDTGAGRAKYADGRLVPIEGEKVYQVVPGPFGSAARIDGVVYGARGALRVRVTGSASVMGDIGPAGKTYKLDESWTVDGDPEIARRRSARTAREAAEEAERDAAAVAAAAAVKAKAKELGLVPATSVAIGDEIFLIWSEGGSEPRVVPHEVAEITENGDAYARDLSRPTDSPGFIGKADDLHAGAEGLVGYWRRAVAGDQLRGTPPPAPAALGGAEGPQSIGEQQRERLRQSEARQRADILAREQREHEATATTWVTYEAHALADALSESRKQKGDAAARARYGSAVDVAQRDLERARAARRAVLAPLGVVPLHVLRSLSAAASESVGEDSDEDRVDLAPLVTYLAEVADRVSAWTVPEEQGALFAGEAKPKAHQANYDHEMLQASESAERGNQPEMDRHRDQAALWAVELAASGKLDRSAWLSWLPPARRELYVLLGDQAFDVEAMVYNTTNKDWTADEDATAALLFRLQEKLEVDAVAESALAMLRKIAAGAERPPEAAPTTVANEARAIEAGLKGLVAETAKSAASPVRERIRKAIGAVRGATTADAREAAKRELAAALAARPGVKDLYEGLRPDEKAAAVVLDERAAALSQRMAGKAPCATEEGVLAATLGEYRTLEEVSGMLGGCDVELVGSVLAKLYEDNRVRKTFTTGKPQRWGHDVPPHREDWAVHRDGDRIYGDTSFLNAAGQLPGFSVKHMGFGEFTLRTPKGEVEFDRMRGKDFPGQTGRSHLLYPDKPEALALLLKEMHVEERLAAERAAPPATPPAAEPEAPDTDRTAEIILQALKATPQSTAELSRSLKLDKGVVERVVRQLHEREAVHIVETEDGPDRYAVGSADGVIERRVLGALAAGPQTTHQILATLDLDTATVRKVIRALYEKHEIHATGESPPRWAAGPAEARPAARAPEPAASVRPPTPAHAPAAGSPSEATAFALAKSHEALAVTDDPAYAAELHRQAKDAHRAASAVQAGGIFAQHNRAAAAHGKAQEAAAEAAKIAKEVGDFVGEVEAHPAHGKGAQKQQQGRAAEMGLKARDAARAAKLAAEGVEAIIQGLEMAFRGHVPPPVSAGAGAPPGPPPAPPGPAASATMPPLEVDDLWSAAKRRDANLAAMRLAAELAKHPRAVADNDRLVLARYSGWGGLSIEEVEAKGGFPAGFPRPSEEGLIHEFYTPTKVCLEVARVVQPLLAGVNGLAASDGYVHALEPACGIARFIRAFSGAGFENVRWHAVEYSPLSAAMVRSLLPNLDLFEGPFQRWVAQHEANYGGRLNLVVSNPPYGGIGTEIAQDPKRSYREKSKSPAYMYFLRRGLDLLAPGGLGIYLIPAGFLSGTGAGYPALRQKVLLRHHLSCAYRLPGEIFPGGHNPAFDLIFFRARPGRLEAVDPADASILKGNYFNDFPQNVLGEIRQNYGRWKTTAVVGEFDKLPELVERPICAACAHIPVEPPRPPRNEKVKRPAKGVMLEEARLASASSLGLRVNWYLAAMAAQESETPVLAWGELHQGLTDWASNHGAPSEDAGVAKLAIDGDAGAQAFLTAFVKGTTKLIPGLATQPTFTPRYTGAANDRVAKAEYLYRQHSKVTREDLGDIDLAPLFAAGWCEDQPGELHPADVYYYGALWPKYDRAKARAAEGDEQAATQARKLLEVLKPALFDDIRLAPAPPPPPEPGKQAPALITPPPPSWFPIDLLGEWLRSLYPDATGIELEHVGGVIKLKDIDYDEMGKGKGGRTELLQTLGWLNHDKYLFTPPQTKEEAEAEGADEGDQAEIGAKAKVTLDDRRQKAAEAWSQNFVAWAGADPERRRKIEETYQRAFQGYRTPDYGREPLDLARWYKGIKLSPHQNAGARRVLANRRGLIAFDVGVGKTYCGLATVAAARQEGWVKRPVILVPASIIWKWDRDIRKCLPDYRVGIVGSKRKTISRGDRAGYETSDTDTPEERARTWRRFQAGEYDVVLMTYESLARTKMREASVIAYARETAAIERQMTIRRRNLERKKELTEREKAVLNQGVAGWIAQLLELREKWEYDPGIIWEDLGIDMLVIDEAQNFKNLYMPEERAGGVPKYMGSDGEGSGRAWQLDFRCAAVRANTGGAGIVLLSATPAKNSPVEFYNLIQLVDHDAWKAIGVDNPEQFIDLFCQIESEDVVNTSTMRYQRESICSGFTNLDMLRSVVFRYGEFKTAEQVGLPLPTPKVTLVEVDMTDEQEEKYSEYLDEIAEAKAKFQFGRAAGYRMRLPLVAIHVDLDEGYTWPSDVGLHEAAEGVHDPSVTNDGVVLPVSAELAIARKPKRVAGFGSKDPFKVLGVARTATQEEIGSAFRQLALEHHPDRNPGDAKADARFKEINGAWQLIGDAQKRAAWNLRAAVGAAGEGAKEKRIKRSAAEVPNPHSPKFDALVKEIVARPGCGHIVFCDNIAAHWWIRTVLIQAGIAPSRIAVMNGITAKEVAERQKIALDFNGDDGDAGDPARGIEPIPPIPPKYDVVIGNGIMHEGVDLQRRTCAIHHLDLPYEPATLQQRNGRGHRQGNKFTEISIFYYFARRSSDGGRFQLIKGKLGWMTALLDSTARDTNNPGAQSRMSKEEEAIFESRDPEATRALIAAAKAAHEAAVNAKIAHEAAATLRGVVERFWRARHPRADEDPVRLRAEAELSLAKLSRVSPVAWPWMSWAVHARDVLMLVPLKGEAPVYSGLRLAKPNVFDPTVKEYVEFGRVFEGKSIGVRRAGAPSWTELELDKVVNERIKPEHVADTWPADDDDLIETKMRDVMTRLLTGSTAKDTWNDELGWHWASDAFLERQWSRFGAEIIRGWRKLPSFWAGDLKVPVLTGGVLSVGVLRTFDAVVPPTEAGFSEFMRLALPSKATWGELSDAARFWWGRTIPRNLVAEREKPEKPEKAAA